MKERCRSEPRGAEVTRELRMKYMDERANTGRAKADEEREEETLVDPASNPDQRAASPSRYV
jgi:hypothetical protein